MTDQKPNCSNCINVDCNYNPKYTDEYKELGEVMADENIQAFVKWNGCFNHPDARAYLMKDVIEELERLSNQNVGSQYKYALTEAITLIKNGVKNDK